MLVVVKKPRIEAKGDISKKTISYFIKAYGKKNVEVIDDEYINVDDIDWLKEIEKNRTPGKTLRTYRQRDGLTQSELAEKLGEYKQNISNMEKDSRPISIEMAKKLSEIFGTHYKRFL
jgi:DNA-binding XRE family transcriptional regulator